MNFFAVEDKGGQHIRTWGTLELQSDLCLGVQRVRCFPFRSDKAWKSNPKNYVAVIPPSKFTDIRFAKFDLADASHRRKLWFGRVELFFQCSFRNSGGREFKMDLALISCLYDFKCPDAQTVLQREGGGSHVLRARYTVADCAAHQPHTGQGASNEVLSLRLKFANNSTRILSSQASTLQIRIRRSERKRGQREPIVHAQRASVAIRETTGSDNICAATSCKQGTGAKGCQSETRSTYALHPGESRATTGDEDSSSVRLRLSALSRPSCR